MTRRRVGKNAQLTRKIGLRVSEPFYRKLEGWLENSNCHTVAELTRQILYEERIVWYQRDSRMDATAAELAGIRKELNAIGSNINQVTRYFHSSDIPNQKIYEALKILEDYKQVSSKVDALLDAISNFSNTWSPR